MADEIAVLAGGCFWCTEAVFLDVVGVKKVESGYTGGNVANPTYKQVCGGDTGHAEVVQITFDPAVISYKQLLEIFFTIHDPTTPNRQGADIGTQYRSSIFWHDEAQKATSEQVIRELTEARLWPDDIVTQVVPLERFWQAEDYHQGYYRANPGQGYCMGVVGPKVAKFRQKFAGLLRT